MKDQTFDQDRRTFLATAGLAAGGVAMAALFPFPAAVGDEVTASSMAPFGSANPDSVWDIDSACGHFPAYSHAIPYAQPQAPLVQSAGNYDPLDHFFVA